MSVILEKIRTRGYWRVRVLPANGEERIATLAGLEETVSACGVSLRGWDFPHFDRHAGATVRHTNYIQQDVDWRGIVEFWRAYKSGQFIAFSALGSEWGSEDTDEPEVIERWLSVEDAIHRFTEIYAFASNWAEGLALEGEVAVGNELTCLDGRQLYLEPRRGGFRKQMVAAQDDWVHEQACDVAALLTDPRELAIQPSLALLEVFGLDIAETTIRDIQSELRS
ncbi:hypothetical protein ACFLSF_00035 [Candidatus Bipolaricaulota bacterium]